MASRGHLLLAFWSKDFQQKDGGESGRAPELLPLKMSLNHYYLSGHQMGKVFGILEQKLPMSLNKGP